MGPMGPMMNYSSGWLILLPVVLLVLVLGIIAFAILGSRGTRSPRRQLSPEDILRERYAKGELSRQQYLDTLIDILKDRCVRGEIELDEYERRLDLLLEKPLKGGHRQLRQDDQ